jgi:hypothetical protein
MFRLNELRQALNDRCTLDCAQTAVKRLEKQFEVDDGQIALPELFKIKLDGALA